MPVPLGDRLSPKSLLDVLIRAGLIAVLAAICFRIFHPFLNLMLWSLILAVTLYPLERRLKHWLGGKDGPTSTVIVLVAITVLLLPIYLLGASVASSIEEALVLAKSSSFQLPPPKLSVASWPLVGKPVYDLWAEASTDLEGVTKDYAPQLRTFSIAALSKLADFGVGLLLFIVALILAGVFMAYGESGHRSAVQIASRIFGVNKGAQITALCTATVRAVAQGVIGIAFIQMILIGIGLLLMGVPAAGFLALAVLFLGIIQAPATLLTVPVIIYVLTTDGVSPMTVVLAIYVFAAGLVDNLLKPLLLGRGVDVPMPVILVGALGGMVTGGVIGLFIGPVVLAVGYELFWQWVRSEPHAEAPDLQPPIQDP
jgi:predicted PurR-regulated permease PerM